MEVIDYLEQENFTGLTIFSFEELKKVFNLGELFVEKSKLSDFIKDGERVANKHKNAIDKADKNLFYSVNQIDGTTRDELIEVIAKYFEKEVYFKNKATICKELNIQSEAVIDDDIDLESMLIPIRRQFYSFLTIVAMHRRYFLHDHEIREINKIYSEEVFTINSNLGLKKRNFNIFQVGQRLENEGRQYIDIDKISLGTLINEKLIHNRKHLAEIARILHGYLHAFQTEDKWEMVKKTVEDYLKYSEAMGEIKPLFVYDK